MIVYNKPKINGNARFSTIAKLMLQNLTKWIRYAGVSSTHFFQTLRPSLKDDKQMS